MAGGGGGGLGLLFMIASRFGFKGILAAVVLVGGLWALGLNPLGLLGDGSPGSSLVAPASPAEDELAEFVAVVLKDTEQVWHDQFAKRGQRYQEPVLELYRRQVRTACGVGDASFGPFYCPGDRKIYIDLSFYEELDKTFDAPGDFAQAYVIAHEVGHHVQKLTGASDKVQARRGKPDYNEYSVRLELQADFYAGVWAHHNRRYLEAGDIEEAVRAANAIGDDAIQKKQQGRVVPHAFTHGTSAQRMRWFQRGFKSGRMEDGDTFSIPYAQL
jgi:predicted metalloprotease